MERKLIPILGVVYVKKHPIIKYYLIKEKKIKYTIEEGKQNQGK